MKWSIQSKLVLGFSLALAILVAISLLSYRNTLRLIAANERVSETRERIAELAGTLASVREAESGQRGFLILGGEDSLIPYNRAVEEIPRHLDQLRILMHGLPEHSEALDRLEAEVRHKFAEMRRTVELQRDGRRDEAKALLGEGTGTRLMRSIRQIVEDLSAAERNRLAAQVAGVRASEARAPTIYFGLVLLECLLLFLGYYLVTHDVSRGRRAEEALRASETFYHSLVESLPQNILRKDRDGRFTFANRRFCEIAGRPLDQIVGRTDYDLFATELAEKYRDDDRRVMNSGEGFETVEEHVTPDGQTHYVQLIKTPLYDGQDVIGIQGIFWDVTERRRAEQRLREQNERLQEMALSERLAHEERKEAQSRMVETAKLAGLGQMVAGVAHEINNPLSFVSNNVAVLQRDLSELRDLIQMYRDCDATLAAALPEPAGRIKSLCDEIDVDYTLGNLDGLLNRTRDGLRRIQQIVKDLRLFARLDESDLNEVDLNAGIDSTVNIIAGHAKKKQVKVVLDFGELPTVLCFPAKINQVVMNLVGNAIDASPEGGTVTIRTREEGTGVRVDVIDEGPGIEPSVRDRIFEPFFTTKPIGVGTGLGLSISYGIVQDHGGNIEVDSEPGRGTRFSVSLPTRIHPHHGTYCPIPTKTKEAVS